VLIYAIECGINLVAGHTPSGQCSALKDYEVLWVISELSWGLCLMSVHTHTT